MGTPWTIWNVFPKIERKFGENMVPLITLVIGFILLVWGADHFVAGASSLAGKFGIPPLIIGLTVVAFGTSAPELTVSVTAGLKEANALAISNVLGSNLFNLLVVIGGCAIFTPQSTDKTLLKRDWPFSILAAATLLAMMVIGMEVSRVDGLILLAGFFLVVGIQVRVALKDRKALYEEQDEVATLGSPGLIAWNILAGLVCIVFGGDLCVEGATGIARMLGLTETIIGLTVVSVGTSLPELVTSLAATRRGEKDIAIGNVVGSNLFNILLILGVSASLFPIAVATITIVDGCVMLGACTGLFFLAKAEKINRNAGIFCVLGYIAYMVWVVLREMGGTLV